MTIDPTASLTMGLRAGMFESAYRCQGCGFATSDGSLYDCPNCGTAWRAKPAPVKVVNTGPPVGTQLRMVCFICNTDLGGDNPPVFAGGSDLACATCLQPGPVTIPEPEVELPAGYAAQLDQITPPKKKRRRRKRKPNGNRNVDGGSTAAALAELHATTDDNERVAGAGLPEQRPA